MLQAVVVVFLVTAVFYLGTMYPSVSGGSSAEVVAAAFNVGLPRPPVHCAWCVFAKLCSMGIPFGSVGFRVNVGTAIAGSVSSIFVLNAATILCQSVGIGFAASMLYSLSPLIWSCHIQSESWGFRNLLFSALLYFFIKVKYFGHRRDLCWLLFICGVMIANDYSSPWLVGFTILMLIMAVVAAPKRLHRHGCKKAFGCFVLGLLFLLYFPVASWRNAPVNWGNCLTSDNFMANCFAIYLDEMDLRGIQEHVSNWPRLYQVINAAIDSLPWHMGLPILVGIGCAVRIRSNRFVVFTFLAAVLLSLSLMHTLLSPQNFPLLRQQYAPPYFLISTLLWGRGCQSIASLMTKQHINQIGYAMGVLIVAVSYQNYWSLLDHSQHYHPLNLGRAVLDPLPFNSILITSRHYQSSIIHYLQFVERVRPDVYVFDQDLLTNDWFVPLHKHRFKGVDFPSPYNLKNFLDSNFGKYQIFSFGPLHDDSWASAGYTFVPFGFVEEAGRLAGTERTAWDVDAAAWMRNALKAMPLSSNVTYSQLKWFSFESSRPRAKLQMPDPYTIIALKKFAQYAMKHREGHCEHGVGVAIHALTRLLAAPHLAPSQKTQIWKSLGVACHDGVTMCGWPTTADDNFIKKLHEQLEAASISQGISACASIAFQNWIDLSKEHQLHLNMQEIAMVKSIVNPVFKKNNKNMK